MILQQQLAPDVVLEGRLQDDGLLKYVAVVYQTARTRTDLRAAVERAREVLKDSSEEVSDVEIRVDELSAKALKKHLRLHRGRAL